MQAGSSLGKYKLERMLGRGGMGEVWAAHDPDLDRRVAIKVVHARLAGSDDARARLQREGRAMAKLRHPNVIAVHDASFDGDRTLVAMELIDGGNLGEWLAKPRTRAEIVAAFLAAGRGLAAAHAAGMVHRDFKPANVLVENSGRIVVTDFGLARAIGPQRTVVSRAMKVHSAAATNATVAPDSATEAPPPAPSDALANTATPEVFANTVTPNDAIAPTAANAARAAVVPPAPSTNASAPTGSVAPPAPSTSALDATAEPVAAGTPRPYRPITDPLAGTAVGTPPPAAAVDASRLPSEGSLDSPLTQEGALLGTPAYMAPEQFLGDPADAAADQFAFCVAFWDALTGARPFTAGNAGDLLDQVEAGRVANADKLPRRLRPLLLRGLAYEPKARWASMTELLDRLERAWRRPRRIAIGAGVIAALAATSVAFVLARRGNVAPDPCIDPDVALASVWSAPIRVDLGARLAARTTTKTIEVMDRWASDWRTLDRAACSARDTAVGKAQRVCLDAVRDQAATLVDMRDAVPAELFSASALAEFLPPPQICASGRASMPAPPPDPIAGDVRKLRIDMVREVIADMTGGTAHLTGIVERARALGYAPLLAEALVLYGGSLKRDAKQCAVYDEALQAADSAAYDRLRADAMIGQLACALRRQDPQSVTDPLVARARPVIERLDTPLPTIRFGLQQANIAVRARRWTDAIDRVVATRPKQIAIGMDKEALELDALLEVTARLGRHHGDDLARAQSLLDSSALSLPKLRNLKAVFDWRRGKLDEAVLGAGTVDSKFAPITVHVSDGGKPVAGAVVRLARQPDVGARITMLDVDVRSQIVTTDAGGDAMFHISKAGGPAIARAGDRVGLALVRGAGPITIELQPAVSIAGTVSGVGASRADDPSADRDRAARRSLPVAVAVSTIAATVFAAPVDDTGAFHLELPPGDYVVGVQVRSSVMDTFVVQSHLVAAAGHPATVTLAMPPTPDVISLVIRPAFGLGLNAVGWIVVFPGSKPPATPAELAVALRAAPAIAVSEVYPAPRSPDLQDSDGYVTLTRPAPGDLVMCAIRDADPLGYIASILGATKPPVCRVLAPNEHMPATLESSR